MRRAKKNQSQMHRKERIMFEELAKEMKQFVKDLEDNIENPKDLEYILKRSETLFDVVFNEINKIADREAEKLKEIRKKQIHNEKRMDELENKMQYLDENVDYLIKDIYGNEDGEFKITCPYCNYEFNLDIDEDEVEILCPECKNIIELDWNDDEEN